MIRKMCILGLCGIAGASLLCSRSAMQAQTGAKKDDLNKQIQQLKKTIADKDQKISDLNAQIGTLKDKTKNAKNAAQLQKDLDQANQSIKDKDDQIASLRKKVRDLEALKKAPYVHSAILTMKKNDDEQVQAVYETAAKTLAKIDGVRGMWIGKRAENGTPELAQKGYQLGLVVLLDNESALQSFLADPLHKQFSDKLLDYWSRPVVYDILRDPETPK